MNKFDTFLKKKKQEKQYNTINVLKNNAYSKTQSNNYGSYY